jgi:hypothetical protein
MTSDNQSYRKLMRQAMNNQTIMIVNTTEYIRANKAENTQRTYQTALREFEAFCRER